jgi:uncharacterized metal-binding protein
MTQGKKTISCYQCKDNACLKNYPGGMPDYCQAQDYKDVVEASKQKYLDPEIAGLHRATAKILKEGGFDWTRVIQCIEFARALQVKKVGLAVCIGLIREGQEFARYLERAGFEVVSVACMIGAVQAKDTGIPEELTARSGISCNPIVQAEIMNREGTGLNFIYGLCVGHDSIFIKNSRAPVTYVVVKDTVTGNNPGVVLSSPYHRMKMNERYGRGEKKDGN